MFGPDARVACGLLELHLATRTLPDIGKVAMCGFPVNELDQNIEKLRGKYGVMVSEVYKESGNCAVYSMGAYSKDREHIFHPLEKETPEQDAPISDRSISDAEIKRILRYGSTMMAASCVSPPFMRRRTSQ